jgi:hypothetical protein
MKDVGGQEFLLICWIGCWFLALQVGLGWIIAAAVFEEWTSRREGKKESVVVVGCKKHPGKSRTCCTLTRDATQWNRASQH